MEKKTLIGKRTPLIDGPAKAAGTAIYVDDIRMPNMLVGKILRSPHAHARVVSIDTSAAEALAGVHAIVVGKEAQNHFGVLPTSKDETAMAVDKVRFIGQEVAAIAADDEEIALIAMRLIKVEYEILPAYIEPQDALKKVAADEKIHAYTKYDNNLHKQVDQHFGDVPAAQKAATFTETGSYRMAGLHHAFTEPHAVLADFTPTPDGKGKLTVWSATQVPHYLHRALAEVMQMEMHRIRVIKPAVGGGFGGKSDPFPHEMCCALLARKAGRPVKILLDREEVYFVGRGRHPTFMTMTLHADAKQKFLGYDLDVVIDGGAFGSFGVVTTYYNGVLAQGPYRMPSYRFTCKRAYTNKPPSGAMRGHGSVNTRFALETLIDRMAEKMGEDPFDLRFKNLLPANTLTASQFRITSNGIKECLDRVRDRSGWKDKFRLLGPGRGIGLGCGFYISGSASPIHFTPKNLPQSTVHLKIDMDGGITIHTGASEIGQGSDTMAAQVVAEVLGVDMARCRVVAVDTDLSPIDLGSYSSRVTFMNGNAAIRAAEQIAGQLRAAAAKLTGVPAHYWVLTDEKLVCTSQSDLSIPFMDALHAALADTGALIAKGSYQSPPLGGTYKGANAGNAPSYSYGAFVAQVAVDAETGVVTVEKVWAAHDCGKVLNPIAVEGQVEGSIHMGLGQALMEDLHYHKGALLNANLLDVRTLSVRQMPEVECILVESNDPEGPFGAKECGEGALAPVLPAVANAIYDAVGVRLSELPMTPDRVLAAIEEKIKSSTAVSAQKVAR